MPFKLIVAGSAATRRRIAGGAPGHADDDQGGDDRLTCDATPSKPNQLPYRLNPPQTRKPDLNARPTMINTVPLDASQTEQV